MMRPDRQMVWWLGLAALLLWSGCTAAVEKTRRPDSDWSRGLLLGRDAAGPATLTFDAGNGWLWVVWPTRADQEVRRVALDAQGRVVREQSTHLPTTSVRSTRLAFPQGEARLFWAGHLPGQPDRLWTAAWPAEAAAAGAVEALSPEGDAVTTWDLAALPDGRLAVVWVNKRDGMVVLRLLGADGQPDGAPQSVVPGRRVALAADEEGRLHLAWVDPDGNVRYARLMPPTWQMTAEHLLWTAAEGAGGPNALALAVSTDRLLVTWSVVQRSGMEAGTAYTAWVSFPFDTPQPPQAARLWVPDAEHPRYRQRSLTEGISRLAPPAPAGRGSAYVERPALAADAGGRFWLAVSAQMALRLDRQLQIVVGVIQEGRFLGVQPATRTETLSTDAALALDAAGNPHLVWREGAAGAQVFYATAAPAARAALNRLTTGDLAGMLARGSLESAVGMALFPVAFFWLLPGLGLVGVWSLLGWSYLDRRPAWAGLVLALAAYQVVKMAFLPTLWTYVPFSAWLDVPDGVGNGLRLAMPPLILGVAVGVAAWGRRRWGMDSLAGMFLLLAGVDALLTLAVYGVNLMGGF